MDEEKKKVIEETYNRHRRTFELLARPDVVQAYKQVTVHGMLDEILKKLDRVEEKLDKIEEMLNGRN